jgi:TolB protein
VTLSNLDGSDPQVFEGAQDGEISPDGTKLVYSVYGAGITVADLTGGQNAPVPGTGNGDFNPIWSPDGKQIVFNRGMGIFDLFMVNPDGSEMRQLTHGGVQEWPVGWLADGRFLYTVPGRENEYDTFQLDVQSGAVEEYAQDNLDSISPDGQTVLTSERTFGDRWLVSISDVDGSNRWQLNDSSLWVLSPMRSPDGEWLLAGVSATDSGSTIGTLINLRTCQVIPIPALKGTLLSWTP